MTKYEHLLAEHRPVADLPDADRIQWIRAERWINHPNAEMALAGMSDLLTYPQRNRMPCLLIHGRTGMGKTMILKKFHRDHPRIADSEGRDDPGPGRTDAVATGAERSALL